MSRVKENPRHRLHNEDPSAESESLVRSPSILGRWFDGSSSVGAANNNYSLVGASEAKKREKRARESERERERACLLESLRERASQPASQRKKVLSASLVACLLACLAPCLFVRNRALPSRTILTSTYLPNLCTTDHQ